MELYKFDPIIYPYKLWIAIGNTPQEIEDKFYGYDGKLIKNLVNDTKGMVAFAMPVMDKRGDYLGCVIYFRNRKTMNYNYITHECLHATKYLCTHVDIDMSWHEPSEYIMGWMAKCCEEVKKRKLRKMTAIKKYKRNRDRPFSALPRRNRHNEHYFPMMATHTVDWAKVFGDGSPDGRLDLPTIVTIDSTEYDWKVISFREPFYKGYEEEIKRG